jgi:DNA-directed RNA polymerase alpha subunit
MTQAWDFVNAGILWMQYDRFRYKPLAAIVWPEQHVRISCVLERDDIASVDDLVKHTEAELLRNPNFGKKSLAVIKAVLAEHGLHLGMSP